MATQEQYNVLRQPIRKLHIKLDLLNENDVIVDSFEGIATDGTISLSNQSTYRRSGNFTMVLDKKYNLIPKPDSKIWFNKRCVISIGVNNYLDKIIWFNLGRIAIDEVDLNFAEAEKTISCQLKDYMVFLDGNLSGRLSHKTAIPANEVTVSEGIKTTVSSLTKVSIEEIQVNGSSALVPYDIEKSPNNTIYDLVKELIEMFMSYDFYFDENGYFIVEKIRDKSTDPIIENFDGSDKDFTLNASSKLDFKNIRNSIWIWGRQLDDGTQIKWVYRNRWSRQNKLDLNNLADKQKGDICFIVSENKSYIWNESDWELLDFKVVPIFNIESIGEKIWSYSDDKIYTEEQAILRTEYELTNYSNFAETINFSIVPLYYLKPQQKIHINIDGEISGDYLIDTLNIPLNIDSPMSITAHRLYN